MSMEDSMVGRQRKVTNALGRCLHLAFAVTTNLACTHGLDVRPVAPHVLAHVEEQCGQGVAPEECLRSKRPALEVRVTDASSVQWARLSADGGFLVASVKSGPLSDGSDISSVVAFDLRARRELWRVQLAEKGRRAPSDCFILPSGVALVIPGGNDMGAGLVTLDAQTGAKKWVRSSDDLRVLGADEENDFVLTAEGHSANLLDGASGKVLATIKIAASDDEVVTPRIYWTPNAAYVVASGVARVARRERRVSWQRRFATYAYTPSEPGYTELTEEGAAALVISGLVSAVTLSKLGVGALVWQTREHAGTDAQYRIGQTTTPIVVGGRLCVGSLGIISCFDETTGAFAWSRRFPLAQFRSLTEGPESLCAAAGGLYVHQQGDALMVKRSASGPLVCLNRADGNPLVGFQTPFTLQDRGVALTQAALDEYDSSAAWIDAGKAAAGHTKPPKQTYPPIAIMGVERGVLVARGEWVHLFELPSGRLVFSTALGDVGSVEQLAVAGDTVVASTRGGFAGFDRRSGVLLWTMSLAVTRVQAIEFSTHDSPGLVRISELAGRQIDYSWADVLDAGMYWLLPELRTLIAGGPRGTLLGVSLDDGSVRWQIEHSGHSAVEGPPSKRALVLISGESVRVYKLSATD